MTLKSFDSGHRQGKKSTSVIQYKKDTWKNTIVLIYYLIPYFVNSLQPFNLLFDILLCQFFTIVLIYYLLSYFVNSVVAKVAGQRFPFRFLLAHQGIVGKGDVKLENVQKKIQWFDPFSNTIKDYGFLLRYQDLPWFWPIILTLNLTLI